MNTVEQIIEKIKHIRKERKIKQEALAKAIGVTTGQYSHYETLKTEISLSNFLKILAYFEMSVKDFFMLDSATISKENLDEVIQRLESLRDGNE
ncbi:helix-turn-helix transcriptional regulator [uncultured Microscilla sp.]|uniref:helix-turn-helix domain-containing protein n=1 Tax=uncultured Microscilla sp. TaxID=432653 RepID=UPI0026387D75|nr:helix-turn-helix transcriptional regulator [uncultured Microscilla sp.]